MVILVKAEFNYLGPKVIAKSGEGWYGIISGS